MSPLSRLFSASTVQIHSGSLMSEEIGRNGAQMGYDHCLKQVGTSSAARNWLAMLLDFIHLADSALSISTISPLFLSLVMALIWTDGVLSSRMLSIISASLLEIAMLGVLFEKREYSSCGSNSTWHSLTTA